MQRIRSRLRSSASLLAPAGFAPATLNLNFTGLNQTLDSRITFTRGSTATFTGSDGLIQSAAINTPRFDYNPVTLLPRGLLIEEQRTNLVLRSVEFDNAAWAKSVLSVTANAATAPDGTLSADKLIADTTTAVHTIGQNISVVSGTTMTGSVYAKAGEYNFAAVLLLTTFAAPQIVICNLSTGAISSTSGSPIATSVTAVGNGWYRISITQVTNATGTATMQVRPTNVGNTTFFTGDGTSGIYVWGAQLEAGAFATSYIPTVAATVTRSADIAQMTGTNFSSWYNQSEGTFVVSALDQNTAASGSSGYFAVGDNTLAFGSAETIYATRSRAAGAASFGTIIDNGVNQANLGNIVIPTGVSTVALAYMLNNSNMVANGSAGITDTSCTMPTPTSLSIGTLTSGWSGASNAINGHLRSITYYPQRLPNATLQALTA